MQDLQMALLQLTHWPDFFLLDLTGILDLTVTGIVFLVENLTDLVTFMGVASPLPFSSCCDLAKEESLFTMSSSEGFLLFFFFYGDIFMEMDEWKNQFEYFNQ